MQEEAVQKDSSSMTKSVKRFRPGLTMWLVAGALLAVSCITVVSQNIVGPTDPEVTRFWRNTGSLNTIRGNHTATLLINGKVLVAGGRDGGGNPLASAELYDPVSETWTITGSLHLSRWGHAAILLGNGKVLVVGGVGAESSSELYDPVTGNWSVTANLHSPKVQSGTAVYPPPGTVLLQNGKVLAVGGGSAELYDSVAQTWTITGSPNTVGNAVALLPNGRVLLVARGSGSLGGIAELFDPVSGSWTLTGRLNSTFDHFYEPTLTLLANGQVLALGGQSTPPGRAELYDPARGTWFTNSFQGTRRQYGHTATRLSKGTMALVGGVATTLFTDAVDLFEPSVETWRPGDSLKQPRAFHTATLLRNGDLLVAGGGDLSRGAFASAELFDDGFDPVVLSASQVEIKTWRFQGRSYAYVKLSFPHAGYRITSWGEPERNVNIVTADAEVERFSGRSVQAVTTTAQIYDLGSLADGNYTFTFRNSGTIVKSQGFNVSSALPPPNPIDNAREFVKQQYRDFLNREPDQAGEDFWTDNITKCSDPSRRPAGQTEAQCTQRQRETTSAAFFLSPEFQYTAYYVYRMYVGALGRQPKLSEFTPDVLFVANGIIVNGQLSAAKINQNKADFAVQFVNCTDATRYRCAEFKAIYDPLNNQQYVDKLFLTTGVTPIAFERAGLVNGLNNGSETRATVLQKVVDGIVVIAEGNQQFTTGYGQVFYNQQLNPAFVQLEYFGYMKRDPDEAGYAFWLGKLREFGGNFVNAQMVLAFISSPEYRARFGQP
jgi:hypothetical protein